MHFKQGILNSPTTRILPPWTELKPTMAATMEGEAAVDQTEEMRQTLEPLTSTGSMGDDPKAKDIEDSMPKDHALATSKT